MAIFLSENQLKQVSFKTLHHPVDEKSTKAGEICHEKDDEII